MGKTTPLNTQPLTRQKSNFLAVTSNPTAIDKMLQQAIGAVSSAIESTERRLSLTPLITSVPPIQGPEVSPILNISSTLTEHFVAEIACAQPMLTEPLNTSPVSDKSPKKINKKGSSSKMKRKRGKHVRKLHAVSNEETVRAQEGTGTEHQSQSQVPPGWVCHIVTELQTHLENLIKTQFKTVLSRLDKVVTLLNVKGCSSGGNTHVATINKNIGTNLVNQENHLSSLGNALPNGPLAIGTTSEAPPTSQLNSLPSMSNECSNTKNEASALKPPFNPQSVKQKLHQSTLAPHRVKTTPYSNEISCKPPCLNLPPEASSYVIVLAGVPSLKPDSSETFFELKNKLTSWLNMYRPLSGPMQGEILFARRVSWLGTRRKDIMGDCVVVNFRDQGVVKHILEWGWDNLPGTIHPLPLGYFHPLDMLTHMGGFDQVPSESCPFKGQGNCKPSMGAHAGIYNISVANRFSSLNQVD